MHDKMVVITGASGALGNGAKPLARDCDRRRSD